MKDLLEQIVKGIVNIPDGVQIIERESVDFPGLTILEILVDTQDKGILIGRKGRTINAIRDIMTISAIRNDKRIKVLVNDDQDSRGDKAPHAQKQEVAAPAQVDDNEPNYNSSEMNADETEAMLSDEM